MNKLQELTKQLIKKLIEKTLNTNDLRIYYDKILSDFTMIDNFDSYKNYRFAGNLFGLMLKIDNFENDPDVRQCMAAIGYYILSKGMEKYTLDLNGNYLLSNQLEHIELLTPRLYLLLESSASIKHTLKLCEYWDEIEYFSNRQIGDPFYDIKEATHFENMLIYDSYTLSKLGSSQGALSAFKESIKLGFETLSNFEHYKDLKDRMELGKDISNKFYVFLKEKFENEKNFDFN